ncbi:TIGR00153 family protein [Salinisphaera sp. Q1T1-3]|uniref:TIGR00153 family protein n=1 Tax=Salinisphaera sp. Q1T1-3 TaxID=2321229 RepID=UPI000E76944D|nr:TIGR00153 family protein [Salinisphaera sp. Q1T1-3]RJS91160.1 TIGR00153 family protein [Salinisphaera sp. Q1T1-3]
MATSSDTGSAIQRLFARSPFKPLFRHIATADAAAGQLRTFLAAARAADWHRAEECHGAIVDLEHEADDLKRDIRLHLPRRLLLPISRGDLLELIEAQDRIINRIKDISGLMLGRRLLFPAALADEMIAFAGTSIAAVGQCRRLLGEFDDLLESGFARDAATLISDSVAELAALEKRADAEEAALRGALLAREHELAPLDAMFIYRIIDWIGTLADRAERAGTRLQILVSH